MPEYFKPVSDGTQIEARRAVIDATISVMQTKYPRLNPNNPEYWKTYYQEKAKVIDSLNGVGIPPPLEPTPSYIPDQRFNKHEL